MMLSNYSTYWASLVDAYLISTVGKPPKSRKKAKKTKKHLKMGILFLVRAKRLICQKNPSAYFLVK